MDRHFSIDKVRSVLILTAALVMIATWGVGATGWTRGINIITFVGIGSILIGTMLARSALPGFIAHIFSIIIGIGWSFWVTSRLLPTHYTWMERWENLSMRLYNWYLTALQGGTSYDNLMFVLQMGVIMWGVGYLAIWFIFRSKSPWAAIVPGGLVLLINLAYAKNDITFWVILYLIVSLILIVRFNLFEQEAKWRSQGIFFRPDINFDFLRDGLIFALLVVAFAWLTPPLVDAKSVEFLDEYHGSWREVQDEWNRLFADLNYRDRSAYDSFGSSLRLGGPRHLSDDPVMDVTVDGIGRYWRAVVYDYYTGDGWLTRDEDTANFGPGEPLSLPIFEMREPVTQTYTYYRDNATVLYAMSNPIGVDRSTKVSFNALLNEQIPQSAIPGWSSQKEPWVEEITYMRSNATVDKNESYQVVSLTSRATEDQLENAGNKYPAWVTDRYLNLPPSTTGRTRDLAREITDDYNNSFAKTQAIERYLRNELTYNEAISAPPAGVDKVDYTLFESKEAYCDYYATSMIVMLRSLNIPARFVAGFAQGDFDSEKGAFYVVNKDAHSWVEVYFPRYGWIEFEPTSAQPNIIRPTSLENNNFASGSILPEELPELDTTPERPENIPIDDENVLGGEIPFFNFTVPLFGTLFSVPRSALSGGIFFIAVVALLVVTGGVIWWKQQNQPQSVKNITSLYQKMTRLAGWMGVAVHPWQTPYEHAATLRHTLPDYSGEVKTITDQYVINTYSNHPGTPNIEVTAAWNRLRPEMLKHAIKQKLPRWMRDDKTSN